MAHLKSTSLTEILTTILNYHIDFCVYDSIGENTIATVDEYTDTVSSMHCLQQFLDTLVDFDTSIRCKYDPYNKRLNFTRSDDPRHYALIETENHVTLVWVANVKTIDKKPVDCDIVLKQWPNPVVNPTETLKQALDDAQDKMLDQLTDVS